MYLTKEVPDLKSATEIAASGFCQPVTTGLTKDVANHLSEGDHVYSLYVANELAGFAIFNHWDDVLYLCGVVIKEEHQGQEAVRLAVSAATKDAIGVKYLALRTQSLRLWVAGFRMTGNWTPNSGNSKCKDELAEVGQAVSARVGSDYPVGKGFYGGPLYGVKPVHFNSELQAWWDSICNFDNGDAVICVGELI